MVLQQPPTVFTSILCYILSVTMFIACLYIGSECTTFIVCLYTGSAESPEEEGQDDLQTVNTESTFCHVYEDPVDCQADLEEVDDSE